MITKSKSTAKKEKIVVHRPLSSYLSAKNLVLLILFFLIGFLWKFKGYFIAATVNGQPISRWQLNRELKKRFGEEVLDNIINERLIEAATRQKGIFITDQEIDQEIKQIENQIKGKMSLEEALKIQGLTKEDLRKQVEIRLSINRMFTEEASVSSEEINDYIKKNSALLKNATDGEMLKDEVKEMLRQQKISELFNNWFSEIRKNATIKKFL